MHYIDKNYDRKNEINKRIARRIVGLFGIAFFLFQLPNACASDGQITEGNTADSSGQAHIATLRLHHTVPEISVWDGKTLRDVSVNEYLQAQKTKTAPPLMKINSTVNLFDGPTTEGFEWGVGDQGAVIATEDGGKHWHAQSSSTHQNLDGILFIDAMHGWAVGEKGTVIATTDGGKHWQTQSSGTDHHLRNIHFSNSLSGTADAGLIADRTTITTEDGGAHWEILVKDDHQPSPNEIAETEKNNVENLLPIPEELYKQSGFDNEKFGKEFLNWQKQFLSDLRSLEEKIEKNPELGASMLLLDDPTKFDRTSAEDKRYSENFIASGTRTGLADTFSNSIDPGSKGLFLRGHIISAIYARQTRVWGVGTTIVNLVSGRSTKPVGYGGVFENSGKNVELWYMEFEDLSNWTKRDLQKDKITSAFPSLELPPYGVTKRNCYPALVFVRDRQGKLMMYGVSSEMQKILVAVFNAQIG